VSGYCTILPTRLSTKLTLRSHCRTNDGGHLGWDVPLLVRRGCWRCSGATSTGNRCLGQYVATEMLCSQTLEVFVNEGAQYVSAISESEDAPVTEESSDDWEATSDQTEADEDEAEEAIELL
jgi:transcription elongation factor Elf1